MSTLLAAAALSLIAGITLGLLGAGGSILTVPILVYVLGVEPRLAIATSMVVVGLTSAASAVDRFLRGDVAWGTGLLFGGAGMGGAMLGAKTGAHLSEPILLGTFATMVIVASVGMFRPFKGRPPTSPTSPVSASARVLLTGAGAGFLTGLVGTGGGFLVVPALVLFGGLGFSRAVGTSLFVISLNCAAGLASTELTGADVPWTLALVMATAAIVGSLVGARLGRRLEQEQLRRAFGVLVLLLGLSILVREAGTLVHSQGVPGWAWISGVSLLVLGLLGWLWTRHRKASPEVPPAG